MYGEETGILITNTERLTIDDLNHMTMLHRLNMSTVHQMHNYSIIASKIIIQSP